MSSSILGLLCLCSEDYYSNSNILQRVTISQSLLKSVTEQRAVEAFEEEVSRLFKMADSYSEIIEAEFHSEFIRISAHDSDDSNSDADKTASGIDGVMLTICMILVLLIDYVLALFNRDDVSTASAAIDDRIFDEECLRLASLAHEYVDVFEDECLSLAGLASTIDYDYIFQKECKRLASLAATICRESEFEKECSRMSRLASMLTQEKEFHQEISRLASLVDTVDNSHLFERECRRISSLVEILYSDSPACECAEKDDPSSLSATEILDLGAVVPFETPKLSEAFTIRTFFRHLLTLSM